MTPETLHGQSTGSSPVLFLALELGGTKWKLAFAVGLGHRPRIVQIPARQVNRLHEEIAGRRPDLDTERRVCPGCDEAGRDGFWIHRALLAAGVANVSSIRRALPSTAAPVGQKPIALMPRRW